MGLFDDFDNWVWDTGKLVRDLFGGDDETAAPASLAVQGFAPITKPVGVAARTGYKSAKIASRVASGLSRDAGALFDYSLGSAYEGTFRPTDFRNRYSSRTDFVKTSGRQFYIAQLAQDLARGKGFSSGGEGFFPGGSAYAEAEAAVKENRPQLGSHSITLGRLGAYPGYKLGLYGEDSVAYKLISGSLDFVKSVKNPVDIFNWAPGAKPAGIAAESQAAAAGMRIAAKEGFVQRFKALQDEVVKLVDQNGQLNKTNLSPEDAAKVDEYVRLTQVPASEVNITVPQGSSGAGRVFKGKDPDDLYDVWKRAADEDFKDFSNKVGLVNGDRVGLLSNKYLEWKNSADGYETITGLRDAVRRGEVTPDILWARQFGRQGYSTARRLVESMTDLNSTVDDYWQILDEATLFSLKGGERVNASRMLASGIREQILDIPFRFKVAAQDKGVRVFEMYAEDLTIGFDDLDGSLQNVERITTILKLDPQEKTKYLNDLAEALENNNSQQLFDWVKDFNDKMVYQKFRNNGYSKQDAAQYASAFRKVFGEQFAYTVDDLGTDVPLPWLDGNGIGPLRPSQLLAGKIQLMDYAVFDQLVEFSGLIGKTKGLVKEIPGGETAVSIEESIRNAVVNYSSVYWKPSRVVSGRHLIRVAPEEYLRAMASGIFESPQEQFMAMINKSLRRDALGKDITVRGVTQARRSRKLLELEEQIDELQDLEKDLAAGKFVDPADQERIAQLPELVDKANRLSEQITNTSAEFNEAMIGGRRRAGLGLAMGDPIMYEKQLYSRGVLQFPSKVTGREGWLRGMAHEFGDMLRNPEYQRIAKGALNDSDSLTINGQTKTIAEHIADGVIHPYTKRPLENDLDAVKLWLFSGDGRKGFEEYWINIANKKPQYENGGWDNYQTASEWIDYAETDILNLTGGEQRLLDILSTGKLNGKTVVKRSPTGRFEAKEEFAEVLQDFAEKPYSPEKVKNFVPRKAEYDQSLNVYSAHEPGKMRNAWSSVMDFYFSGVYGNVSDFIARNPVPRAAYWRKMEELIPGLSSEEAAKLVEQAKKAKLSNTRVARIETAAAAAKSDGTIRQANVIANDFAVQYTRNLLYDASKRSLFGKSHPLMFSFFESQREVTQTWLRTITMNPAVYRNIAQFQETAIDEGWIYENEQGRKVFEIPMSAAAIRALTGGKVSPTKNFTVGTDAVNVALQMRPAVGFVAQYVLDQAIPDNWDIKEFIQEVVSPFGSPDFGDLSIAQVFFPEWMRQFFGGAIEAGPEVPVVSDAARFVFGDVEKTKQFAQYRHRAVQYLYNNHPELYSGQDGFDKAMDDAKDMATKWIGFRGFIAGFGPGAPMTEWLATTKYGQVEVGILLDDLNKLERDAVAAGEPSYNGFNRWIEKWGESVWVYTASLSQPTIAGQSASKEFEAWSKDNRDFLDKYKYAGGYFGPRGEFDLDVYSRQIEAERWQARSPEDAISSAQNKMGNYLYYKFTNQFPDAFKRTPDYKVAVSEWANQIKTDYPGWERPGLQAQERSSRLNDQLIELRRMAQDDEVDPRYSEPVTKYFAALDEALSQEAKRGVTLDNWGNSKAGFPVREYIRNQVVPNILAQHPEFTPVWEQVLSYELQIDEPQD
jgi:hypothetical protein